MSKSKILIWSIVCVGAILVILISARAIVTGKLGIGAAPVSPNCTSSTFAPGSGAVAWDKTGNLSACATSTEAQAIPPSTTDTATPTSIPSVSSTSVGMTTVPSTSASTTSVTTGSPTLTDTTSSATRTQSTPSVSSTTSAPSSTTTLTPICPSGETCRTSTTSPMSASPSTPALSATPTTGKAIAPGATGYAVEYPSIGNMVETVITVDKNTNLIGAGVKCDNQTIPLAYNVSLKKIGSGKYKYSFPKPDTELCKTQQVTVQAVGQDGNLYETQPIQIAASGNQFFRSWWFILWFLVAPGAGIQVSMLSTPMSVAPPALISSVNYFALSIFIFSSALFVVYLSFALYKIYRVSKENIGR